MRKCVLNSRCWYFSNKLIQFRVTLVKSYTTKKGGVPFGKFYALDDSVEIPCVVYDEIWSKWKDLLKVLFGCFPFV